MVDSIRCAAHQVLRIRSISGKSLWLIFFVHFVLYFQAPGEADAELGQLNARGYIHGIIISGSDVFLYGATHALRRYIYPSSAYYVQALTSAVTASRCPNTSRKFVDQHLYAAGDADEGAGFPLTQRNVLLFALICGGDSHNGTSGCGLVTAKALVRFGFGE